MNQKMKTVFYMLSKSKHKRILYYLLFFYIQTSFTIVNKVDFWVPEVLIKKIDKRLYNVNFNVYNLSEVDTIYLEVPYPYSIDLNLCQNYFNTEMHYKMINKYFYNIKNKNDTVKEIVDSKKVITYTIVNKMDFISILPRKFININLNMKCHRSYRRVHLFLRYSKNVDIFKDQSNELVEANSFIESIFIDLRKVKR